MQGQHKIILMSKTKDIERKESNGTFLYCLNTCSNSSNDMGGEVMSSFEFFCITTFFGLLMGLVVVA